LARYRFLEAHYIAGARVIPAGVVETTVDEGGILPTSFVPDGACEPMDRTAIEAFYRAGPAHCRIHPTVNVPTTYWLLNPATKEWSLTGLGADLPPKKEK
jgi:hypothetical protein